MAYLRQIISRQFIFLNFGTSSKCLPIRLIFLFFIRENMSFVQDTVKFDCSSAQEHGGMIVFLSNLVGIQVPIMGEGKKLDK